MLVVNGQNNNMQPNFATLKPVNTPTTVQPNFSQLQPTSTVSTPTTTPSSTNDETGSNTAVIPANPAGETDTGLADALKMIPNAAGDIFNLIKGGTYGTAKNILYNIPKEAAGLVQENNGDMGKSIEDTISAIPESTLKVLWGIIPNSAKNLANTDALSEIPSQFQDLAKSSGGYANAFVKMAQAVPSSLSPAMQQYANQIDKARQSFENHPVNEALGYLGMKEMATNPGFIMDALKTTGEFVKNPIANTTEALKPVGDAVVQGASAIKNKISPTPTIDQVVGQVAQGKTGDIPSFTNGLKNIGDTSKIQSYDDLNKASTKTIGDLANQQDKNLAQETKVHPMSDFDQTTGSGKSAVKTNYVQQALDQLQQYYTKTNDATGLSNVKALTEKANGEGLTVQDVNNLARLHGKDLNGFNANGELASGLTKQAAENTRVGLKNTVENSIQDPTIKSQFRALDGKMSDTFTVKDLSGKMAEKVNTLEQRLQQPNILQKIGGIVGKGLRITGVGDLVQKLVGIEKVPGASTLNPVELEAKLSKNLGKITTALGKDDAGFTKDISSILTQNNSKNP